ncbi:MAG TPA: ABC transporter permease [Micromonosporaceae bacterium]|nr:ABC transporter permease [Micromonosporaceae bacterium]
MVDLSPQVETAPTGALPAGRPARGTRALLRRYRDFSLIPVILLLLLLGFIASPNFLTADNMLAVLQQSTELSLLVLAEALVLIAGQMDLSLESTIGVAPVIAVWLVLPSHGARFNGLGLGLPGWTALPLCLLVGAAIGALIGVLRVKVRLNAFIVTLGMLITLRGLQTAITGGQSIFQLPRSFTYLGSESWFGVPASVWVCAALFGVGIAVLGWYRHGRALYAVGGNADAAQAAGIRTGRLVWIVFVVAGMLAAFAGILYTGHYGSIAANQGQGMIFQVFAATVIGGVSLNGGRGSVFGALTGAVTLKLIDNVLNFAGVYPVWEQFLDGVIILCALVISRFTSGEAQD